jgi:hypothetical protein
MIARALPAPWIHLALVALLLSGCEPTALGRTERDAPDDRGAADADSRDAGTRAEDATSSLDGGHDAGAVGPSDDAGPPLGPPLSRPPAGPPDHAHVIATLAAEQPALLATSCVPMGGTHGFLFEAVRRLRAIDPRYGLITRSLALTGDRVGYFWGEGAPEGSTETYVIDIVLRHCGVAGVDAPPAPGWGDDTAAGGTWTIAPLTGPSPELDAGMPVDAGTPSILPLPDMSDVVDALAAERPDLLAASCITDPGGNNEFLFELVRRLRRVDVRWGLNWTRARVGDMSQDVVDYYYGPGAPYEEAYDVYVVDVIGGHCGPSPSPAWIDVTVLGTRGAMWTLAGRGDLGP